MSARIPASGRVTLSAATLSKLLADAFNSGVESTSKRDNGGYGQGVLDGLALAGKPVETVTTIDQEASAFLASLDGSGEEA
jgi:hypothetical protein